MRLQPPSPPSSPQRGEEVKRIPKEVDCFCTKKNFITHCAKLSVQVISALALAGPLLLLGGSEALALTCLEVHGRFVNQVAVPNGDGDCGGSVIGFCVSGRAIGVLNGDFLSTFTGVSVPAGLAGTDVAFLTADLVLHTTEGDLVQLQDTCLGIAIPSPLWGEGEGEGNRMGFQPPSPPSSPASGRGGKSDSQRGWLFLH